MKTKTKTKTKAKATKPSPVQTAPAIPRNYIRVVLQLEDTMHNRVVANAALTFLKGIPVEPRTQHGVLKIEHVKIDRRLTLKPTVCTIQKQ